MKANKWYDVEGTRLAAFVEGSGPPVLFVHAFPLDHTMWRAQVEACRGYTVIAPDLRGFGESEASPGTTSMDRFAADLHACLDQLSVDGPVVFVGLSMGGYVAWPFLLQRRDRMRGLVLANTRVVADSPAAAGTRRQTAAKVVAEGVSAVEEPMLEKLFSRATRVENPGALEEARAMIRRAKPVGVAGALLGMAERADVSERLASVDVPTLVVAGAEDQIVSSAEMEGFARAIPNAEFVRIERAGHMTPLEAPSEFNAALGRLLGRVETKA